MRPSPPPARRFSSSYWGAHRPAARRLDAAACRWRDRDRGRRRPTTAWPRASPLARSRSLASRCWSAAAQCVGGRGAAPRTSRAAAPPFSGLGALNLFVLPFGTALGIYAFWVLLHNETRGVFVGAEGLSRDARARTWKNRERPRPERRRGSLLRPRMGERPAVLSRPNHRTGSCRFHAMQSMLVFGDGVRRLARLPCRSPSWLDRFDLRVLRLRRPLAAADVQGLPGRDVQAADRRRHGGRAHLTFGTRDSGLGTRGSTIRIRDSAGPIRGSGHGCRREALGKTGRFRL